MTDSFSNTSSQSVGNTSLNAAQKTYQYNYTHIPPIAMLDVLPESEQFSPAWFKLLAKQLTIVFVNTLATNRGKHTPEEIHREVRRFILEALLKGMIPLQVSVVARLLQVLPQLLLQSVSQDSKENDSFVIDLFFSLLKKSGLSIFEDALSRVKALLAEGHPTGHVTQLEDYQQLFPVIPIPDIAQTLLDDDTFAYLRVAGFNPVMIERISALDDRFPVTEAQYQAVMGNDDRLAEAGQEGRLYLADYQILDGAVNGTFPQDQKYLYAPLALFAVPKGVDPDRRLRPVAIQCGQNPARYPVITPQSDANAWRFAKMVVQVADANFHEAVTHLARTHLFVGAFTIATLRQLPIDHPVGVLLRPHFEGTLAINDAAQRMLIAPKGGVDQLLSATIDNARVFVGLGFQSYGFNDAMLPNQLQQRGVDDADALPVYPYRDDALLIWEAIHQWVADYVNLYYATDEAVQADRALQAWAAEVQAHDGGRVANFGEADGRIATRDYLVDALTLIIFTASAQHGAVNFTQKDLMAYPAIVSMAGYLPADGLSDAITEQDYYDLLAPLDQAQEQLNLLYLLGSIYYTQLGEYGEDYFSDPRVASCLQSFQASLKQIESIIHDRNQQRPVYEYLLPSKIPQSINI